MDMSTLPPRRIHPLPQIVKWGSQVLDLPADVTLRTSDGLDFTLVDQCRNLWNKFTLQAGKLRIEPSADMDDWSFSLCINGKAPAIPASLGGSETYRLEVDNKGIAARAADRGSLLHAWMSFVQMLEPHDLAKGQESFAVPQVSIIDWPAIPFRGLHLCIFPETKMLLLKKVIHLAGLLKYSHVVLEFWGSLQLDAMKELAWPGSLTKTQANELLDVAKRAGVEVIPMFNVWGHAAGSRCSYGRHVVLDQNPMLATLFEPDGWTWCLTNKSTQSLLKDIVGELCDFAGPGAYFHLGCDEAYSHGTCDRCRQHSPEKLYANHVNTMADVVGAMGRRPIIWGDALLDREIWKPPFDATSHLHAPTHKALGDISRQVIIADWQYDTKTAPVTTLEHFKTNGFDVLACPFYDMPNIRALAQSARAFEAMGMLITTWNHLPKQIVQLFFSATACWHENVSVLDLPQFLSIQRTTASHYTRVLSPPQGRYHDSGWVFQETNPWEGCGQ